MFLGNDKRLFMSKYENNRRNDTLLSVKRALGKNVFFLTQNIN